MASPVRDGVVGVGKVGGKNGDGWSMDAEMDSLGTFEW